MLAPREPPPLYSWEVVPGLYPALPPPRAPRWRARRTTAVALIGIVVLAVVFAGILTYYGSAATVPSDYLVSGTVLEESSQGLANPASGARVVLTEDGGSTVSSLTGPSGTFTFANVPNGGIALNVHLSGYQPGTVSTFASPVYDAGTTGLLIVLVPSGMGNSTNQTLSPFSSLENFLASVGAGVALLGVVASLGVVTAVLTLRHDRPALGVVGGGAGLFAPVGLYFLALGTPFPLLIGATTFLAAFGAFALALRAAEIAQTAPTPGPD